MRSCAFQHFLMAAVSKIFKVLQKWISLSDQWNKMCDFPLNQTSNGVVAVINNELFHSSLKIPAGHFCIYFFFLSPFATLKINRNFSLFIKSTLQSILELQTHNMAIDFGIKNSKHFKQMTTVSKQNYSDFLPNCADRCYH